MVQEDCDLGELANIHDWKSARKKRSTKMKAVLSTSHSFFVRFFFHADFQS